MRYEGIRTQFCCNRIVYTLFMYVVSRKAIDVVFMKFHFWRTGSGAVMLVWSFLLTTDILHIIKHSNITIIN